MEKKKPTVKVANINVDESKGPVGTVRPLTAKEMQARQIAKQARNEKATPKLASVYSSGDVMSGSGGNWYSPQLSTDFLEKPQNLRERRAWYRHFYNSTEIVGAAIDLHSTIPLSKIRLRKPKASNPHIAEYSYRFFSRMVDRLKLLKTLTEISHEYWLFGNAFLFVEDHAPYQDLGTQEKAVLQEKGKAQSDLLLSKFQVRDTDPNYIGWRKIMVLPPDQVRIVPKPFADNPVLEYLPDAETRGFLAKASVGGVEEQTKDRTTQSRVPEDLMDGLEGNAALTLQQDPYEGSFAYHLARKKSQYETMGVSILERCINTLLVKDKLRQAQTSIASRHMTPTRIVWGENLNEGQVDDLRSQVDLALMDPDYSIIANYEVHWEEFGSNQRLLDLNSEFERYDSDLYAGLGVTKEMMTGEASYSGSKISLELLNIQYMLFRDVLQEFIEKSLFEPVARRKGFVEKDEYGNETVIVPKISFTRLSIRDNDSVFEQVMALYNKGSAPVDDVFDILGLDGDAAAAKLENDMFTVKDASFNDLLRGAYQQAGQELVTRTNLSEKLAQNMGLALLSTPPGEEGAGGGIRFASKGKSAANALFKKIAEDPSLAEKVLALLGDTDEE
jgi:hypothetical protein